MTKKSYATPRGVTAVLERRGTWALARIGLTSAYVLGGLTKLLDFQGAIQEQAHFGLRPPAVWAVLTILVELAGSALVISGRLVWLGAGALGVLTAVAGVVAEPFWAMRGHDQLMAANGFFERLGLIAGFVLIAVLADRAGRAHRPARR